MLYFTFFSFFSFFIFRIYIFVTYLCPCRPPFLDFVLLVPFIHFRFLSLPEFLSSLSLADAQLLLSCFRVDQRYPYFFPVRSNDRAAVLVTDVNIILLLFYIPLPIFFYFPRSAHDMGMGIVAQVMDIKLDAHSFFLQDPAEFLRTGDAFLHFYLDRKRNFKFAEQDCITLVFDLLHGVPERFSTLVCGRSIFRKEDFVMHDSFLPGIVENNSRLLVSIAFS